MGVVNIMRISTLGYAILTLLARSPFSGYDLARYMKQPIGFFWQAQLSQIYPELARLEEQGCVLHEIIVQDGRPSKKLYAITEAGRATLTDWVTQPPSPVQERNELLLKTYAIWLADPTVALELFQKSERWHREQLTLYEEIQATIEREYEGSPRPHEPSFGDYATVRMGVAYEREYVDWCRWVIQQLEQAAERHKNTT